MSQSTWPTAHYTADGVTGLSPAAASEVLPAAVAQLLRQAAALQASVNALEALAAEPRIIPRGAAGVWVGAVVRNVSGSVWQLAKATSAAEAGVGRLVGVVSEIDGDAYTVITSGIVPVVNGFTPGETLYLSTATAGELANTAPTTAGYIEVAIGTVIDGNTLEMSIQPPVTVTDPSVVTDAIDGIDARVTALENAGGGGLSITTLTVTTGEIAGGGAGTEDINVELPSSNVIILGVSVALSAGASTSVGLAVYNTDAFSTKQAQVVGAAFGGETPPFWGPGSNSGGSNQPFAVPYHDYDETSEMHLRVSNADFTAENAGTYVITLQVLDLGDYPA